MKKCTLYIFILIFLISLVQANVVINEIFYDTIGSDEDHEWIEIYNNGGDPVNLIGWKFFENGVNHFINLKQGNWTIDGFSYGVISEDWGTFLIEFPEYNKTLFDSSFSLSNTGETIALKNSSLDVVNSVSYDDSIGGKGNGFSIGLIPDAGLEEIIPSPGEINEQKDQDICDYQASVESEKIIFENKTDVNWKFIITKLLGDGASVLIDRTVENEFGEQKVNYNMLNKTVARKEILSHSPNLNPGVYILGINITVDCIDINLENNFDSKLVVVKGVKLDEDSTLHIDSILDLGRDKKAKWGQIIRVRVNLYKGDTSKRSLRLYAKSDKESVSKESKTSITERFTNQTLTLPLQLDPNCNKKYPDGAYKIIFDGLGERVKEEIEIEGLTNSLCKGATSSKTSSGKLFFELIEIPEIIETRDDILTTLKIENTGDASVEAKVWSYLYKGSKSLSGGREDNIQTIVIPKQSTRKITLKNILIGSSSSGNYKLKVKILQNGRKTADEFTKDVYIGYEGMSQEISTDEHVDIKFFKENSTVFGTGQIIYQSGDLQAMDSALYFFIGALVLLYIYLIVKKDL